MLSHMTVTDNLSCVTDAAARPGHDSSLARRAQRTAVMTSGLLTIRPDSLAS